MKAVWGRSIAPPTRNSAATSRSRCCPKRSHPTPIADEEWQDDPLEAHVPGRDRRYYDIRPDRRRHRSWGAAVNVEASVVKATESHVLKWADKLTTDSKIVQKAYKEKLGIDFELLYAPLDIKKFNDIPNVSKIENQVVYIGRDSFEKGIDILKNIESEIHGSVVYCTNVDWKQAMTVLKSSCLLVIPSRMESIPQVIKEAFFLHVPVIATNIGGIPELITDNVSGILVPSNDEVRLLDAINSLLEDKEKAAKLADAGFEFVTKNLTWEVLLPRYIEFYENLVKS